MNTLTYPARPMNGGPLNGSPKLGRWLYEPKYNGWRVLVHVPTGTCFNRHGQPLSIQDEFAVALGMLRGGCPYTWLDCEALERRHGLGRGTLILLDILDRARIPYERRMLTGLEWPNRPSPLPLDKPPAAESGYTAAGPFEGLVDVRRVWDWMQRINQQWGCTFYEGVVAKRADSLYPLQLQSPDRTTPDWVKHRFV